MVIGENINATRKIKISSPRILDYEKGKRGMKNESITGEKKYLDLREIIKTDPV